MVVPLKSQEVTGTVNVPVGRVALVQERSRFCLCLTLTLGLEQLVEEADLTPAELSQLKELVRDLEPPSARSPK